MGTVEVTHGKLKKAPEQVGCSNPQSRRARLPESNCPTHRQMSHHDRLTARRQVAQQVKNARVFGALPKELISISI